LIAAPLRSVHGVALAQVIVPMLQHSTNEQLRLLALDDIRSDRWWGNLPWRSAPFYLAVAWWIDTFVCDRHAELGRPGHVCPFVKPAIDRNLFWLTGHEPAVDRPEDLQEMLLGYRDWFLELQPREDDDRLLKTIVIVFPLLQSEAGCGIIDAAQRLLKPAFVSQGLMLGQFHPLCEEQGVRNANFRPLRSPVPLLVIRPMTRFDLPFLTAPAYLKEYQLRFGDSVPGRFQALYREALGEKR
jgi:hypothetical protein